MRNQELVDYRQLHEEKQDYPRVVIHSERQLREQLTQLRQRLPGVYHLDAADGETLRIAIGGRVAALSWAKPPAALHSLTAVARSPIAEIPVSFTDQGLLETYDPEYLFPVEEIIEAVVYFYQTHRVPEWLDWEYWNPDTTQWETKRGTGAPPSASAQAGGQPAPSLVCPGCTVVVDPRGEEARQEVCPRCGEPATPRVARP